MSNALHLLWIFLAIVAVMILLRRVHLRESRSSTIGTFTIRDFDGNVTAPIPYNATLKEIQREVKRSGVKLCVSLALQHETTLDA
jgi:hypothetical protein